MNLELSEKERKALLELLEDHLYFGWVEKDGEFGLVATWRLSFTLERLYQRLKNGGQEPPPPRAKEVNDAG